MENDPNVAWLARTYRKMSLTKAFASGFVLGAAATLATLLVMAGNAHAAPIVVEPVIVPHVVEVAPVHVSEPAPVSHPIDVDAPATPPVRMVPIPHTNMVAVHVDDSDTDWTRTPNFVCKYSPVLSDNRSVVYLCARARKHSR